RLHYLVHHVISLLTYFFFSRYRDHRDLHSFPTRRSSDLRDVAAWARGFFKIGLISFVFGESAPRDCGTVGACCGRTRTKSGRFRSEEHTSELQSPCNLVCRLLLEKKKKKKTSNSQTSRRM